MSIEFGLVDNSDCIFLLKYKSFKVTGVCAATNLNTEDKVRVNNCIINTSSFEGLAATRFFVDRRKNMTLDNFQAIQLIWNLKLRRGSIKASKNLLAGTVESVVILVRFVIKFSIRGHGHHYYSNQVSDKYDGHEPHCYG